ncbi:hypothetical protein KC19_2G263700 [Ceratodon purpureus]|uniref:Uncharacterized protein n=1 Tax=Ceratodon purpureus TaxID=3225 RepID=A0A8T0J1E7_CERPU|nr:hypothetical protein KC19_2G263700 [Ceratodon purpureus]
MRMASKDYVPHVAKLDTSIENVLESTLAGIDSSNDCKYMHSFLKRKIRCAHVIRTRLHCALLNFNIHFSSAGSDVTQNAALVRIAVAGIPASPSTVLHQSLQSVFPVVV